jgi:hypothetical protein
MNVLIVRRAQAEQIEIQRHSGHAIRRRRRAVLLLLLSCYLAASFLIACHGYGEDTDSYGMLNTWQTMLLDGRYAPSRFQGNIVPEFIIGFLASLFGPYGPNFFSIAVSLTSVFFAARILAAVSQDSELIAWSLATVLLNPTWILAGSTSVDYLYPIAASLGGILLLMRRRPTLAALAFAIATGSRISYAPLGLAALLVGWWLEPEEHREFLGAIVTYLLTAGLFYLPVWISSHLGLDFLRAARPVRQGFAGLVVRFIYKIHSLYGFAGTYLVAGAIVFVIARRRKVVSEPARVVELCAVGTVVFYLVLFLWIPVLTAYLLPVLLAVAALFVIYRVDRRVLGAIVALEIILWFVRIKPLTISHETGLPCHEVNAVAARFEPHLAKGVLLPDLEGVHFNAPCSLAELRVRPPNPYAPLPPSPFGR